MPSYQIGLCTGIPGLELLHSRNAVRIRCLNFHRDESIAFAQDEIDLLVANIPIAKLNVIPSATWYETRANGRLKEMSP